MSLRKKNLLVDTSPPAIYTHVFTRIVGVKSPITVSGMGGGS